jgi:hypothetical protein
MKIFDFIKAEALRKCWGENSKGMTTRGWAKSSSRFRKRYHKQMLHQRARSYSKRLILKEMELP